MSDSNFWVDDAFSIGTGLERAGIAEPVHWLWMLGSSAKQETKRIDGGSLVFSTGTGLERAGIYGPVRWLWMSGSSAKQETKRIGGGSPVASLMPKSVLSGGRED